MITCEITKHLYLILNFFFSRPALRDLMLAALANTGAAELSLGVEPSLQAIAIDPSLQAIATLSAFY